MAQKPPGGDAFTTPDPVVWAKLVPDGQDHSRNARDGTHSYRETWLVRTSAPNTPLSAVRASKRIPADGMALYPHEVAADPTLLGTYMRPDGATPTDANVGVVLRDVKATKDPYYFLVSVSYEGLDDPTAETPEVSTEEVAYQEHLTFDVNGRPVMNSAFDPIDGGMPSEGFYKKVTITRNLPYLSWSQKTGDKYRKTLNRADFVYSQQFLTDGVTPLKEPPGAVLIDGIREQRLQRSKVAGASAATRYYWRVTVELLVDLQEVRVGADTTLPDGTTAAAGTKVRRLHRWVVPDAGYHALVDDGAGMRRKQAIRPDVAGSSSPQLLNGRGEVLTPRSVRFEPMAFPAYVSSSVFGGLCPDYYAARTFTDLVVANAQGVLANDTDPTITSVEQVGSGSQEGGTVTLASGGGFTYKSAAGFKGWDRFFYKPTGGLDSAKQVVQILVGVEPVLLWFDRYRFSNWADIAVLLEGW
jgi:hypothetical protein